MHRSAAKPYSDTSAKNTILDIMSGYFPIVLKQEFPDGVPLKVQHGNPLMLLKPPVSCLVPSTIASKSNTEQPALCLSDQPQRDSFSKLLPQPQRLQFLLALIGTVRQPVPFPTC